MKEKGLNRIKCLLVFIAAFLYGLQNVYALRIDIEDGYYFVGDSIVIDGDKYLNGTVYGSNLSKARGIFTQNFDFKLICMDVPAKGLIYVNNLYQEHNSSLSTVFDPGKKYMELCDQEVLRSYDFEKRKWVTQNFRYQGSKVLSKDEEDDFFEWLFCYIAIPGLIFIAVYFMLREIPCKWNLFESDFVVWVLLMSAVLSLFFIKKDTLFGMFFPLICFFAVYGIASLFNKRWVKLSLRMTAVALFFFLIGYQFFWLSEQVIISDNEICNITWKRGSDPIKRIVVRNILDNMIKVPNTDYYMSKYELRSFEKSIIMGDDMGWVTMLFPNKVQSDLSYHDAQLIIGELKHLTGNDKFTLPSTHIWANAVSTESTILLRTYDELQPVGAESPNEFGFYDLEGNVSEWTNDISYTRKMSRHGVLLPDASYAMLAGGKYYKSHLNIVAQPKILNFANGMRVCFGDNYPKRFRVWAVRNDSSQTNLPQEFILTKVNGELLADKSWDQISDMLISLSDSQRIYSYCDISKGVVDNYEKKITINGFTEPYLFIPVFNHEI